MLDDDAKKSNNKNNIDTYSYQGWLNSDNFFKRAFGVFGYNFVARLIITSIVLVIVLVFGILISIFIFFVSYIS